MPGYAAATPAGVAAQQGGIFNHETRTDRAKNSYFIASDIAFFIGNHEVRMEAESLIMRFAATPAEMQKRYLIP